VLVLSALHATAQDAASPAATLRIEERLRALQIEADRLAGSARTLLGELRTLEIARELRGAEAARADADLQNATQALAATTDRLDTLERQRAEQEPALKAQLVDLYKRGDLRYTALLFRAGSLREFSRTSRALAAAGERNHRRVEAHRQTMAALGLERVALEKETTMLNQRRDAALQARLDAERAVKAHTSRLADIDSRRDLTAQYVGELQVARERLFQQLADREHDRTPAAVGIPLTPFRGALAWPVNGTLAGRFGQASNRLGGSAVRNGVEISAPIGSRVQAVHGGTVAHADPFTGFGTLVILDHGANQYTLYGYLGATAVVAGQAIEPGTELGQVGASPAGPPALYFEIRIDGRSVDPVQWLQLR
jgi:septal ring factor EnvC (AmiA/AmiB activator)